MVQGCYAPGDLVLSVVEMSVEFVISTRPNSASLVRMALFRVSKATEDDANASFQLLFEALLYAEWAVELEPQAFWG